jgi:tetratricopeptide (TPR) repeat protein
MLETIREFAIEQMTESGEAAALQRRHAGYFLSLAQRCHRKLLSAGRDPYVAMLEHERDNLRAVMQWSLGENEPEVGLQILGLLWQWYLYRNPAEGERWSTMLLDAPGAQAPSAARGWGLIGAAACAYGMQKPDRTAEAAREALSFVRDLDDPWLLAMALSALGVATPDLSARDSLEEAGRLFLEQGSTFGYAMTRWFGGRSLSAAGDLEAAIAWTEEGLATYRRDGDRWGQGVTHRLLGLLEARSGDLEQGSAHLRQSVPFLRQQRDYRALAEALFGLGSIARLRGDLTVALDQLIEAIELSREIGSVATVTVGSTGTIVACLVGLAGVMAEVGQLSSAAMFLGAAEGIRTTTGARPQPLLDHLNAGIDEFVRPGLEEAAFESAWMDGMSMPMEQAIERARDSSFSPADLDLQRELAPSRPSTS